MRIKLKRGKQRKLIFLAKRGKTWAELAMLIKIPRSYISGDLKREKNLLSAKLYNKLCKVSNVNFNKFIIEKLKDSWGKSRGGMNSDGSTIKLVNPEFSSDLAEFVGAVLGDGHVCFHKSSRKDRKIGTYCIRIAGDLNKDKEYHSYLRNIGKRLFGLEGRESLRNNTNERFLDLVSKELVNFFIEMGIKPGNKIVNKSTIPKWIFKDDGYLRACVRGLIDTDGSIFRMSQRDFNLLRISFSNHNLKLLKDARMAFIKLGFHPSKIIRDHNFYLSRKNEIEKYLKEIGFSNKKHLERLKSFKAPWCSGQISSFKLEKG